MTVGERAKAAGRVGGGGLARLFGGFGARDFAAAPGGGIVREVLIGEGAMPAKAVFSMELDPELEAAFVAAASAADRLAPEVVRDMMRDYVERQREAPEYDAFLQRKVDRARRSLVEEGGVVNEAVTAWFAELRAKAVSRA